MKENIYRYQPTQNGMQYTTNEIHDPTRETSAVLYPDNRRELLFGSDDLLKIVKYPFRPVALAKLAPRYEMELHCVSGMAGYGRFAVVRENETVWLDEFEHIETEYYNGEMRYTVQDDRIAPKPVNITFIAGRGACGMIFVWIQKIWMTRHLYTICTAVCLAGIRIVRFIFRIFGICAGVMP